MFCPSCLAEYREGFTHCPDCDVDLVPELPSGDEPMELDAPQTGHLAPDAVEVYRAYRDIEAEMLKSVLDSAGIPAALFRGGVAAYMPGIPGEVRVMVAREHTEAAVEEIRQALAGDNSLD